jgi:beta-1,4-mannooligosaccharide/beta-1,4-mannosyl-N-acetylglucosamine phosphorylase
MQLHAGFSDDGINWRIDEERIHFVQQSPATHEVNEWLYGYDPRVVFIEDRYWITWCNAFDGHPTIGVGYTFDFKTFYQCENAFLPFNRNGVLFPRKIGGKYVMLSRPSDDGHTPFGDIYISHSPDMKYWGEHRHVMSPFMPWESKKIGAGPIPIETSEGWLCFYHGVLESCNGFVYSFGAALLDLKGPWKVLRRGREYLLSPQRDYECVGDVPNVVFPCAALTDADTGRIAIYYGCADTCTGLCFTTVDDVIAWLDQSKRS